jgi:hypothetical protein
MSGGVSACRRVGVITFSRPVPGLEIASVRVIPAVAVAVAGLAVLWSRAASAQPVASAYLHANGGDVEIRRGGFGVTVGYIGRLLGVELDADRHHHFYKDSELELIPNPCVPGVIGPCIDGDTDAWVLTANVVSRIPIWRHPKWRPYASAGAGLIYAWIHGAREYDSDQLNPTVNLGAGVTYWLRDWVGFRADLRYFHAFVDESALDGGYASDYDFGRLSLGVAFSWPPGPQPLSGGAPSD